MGQLSAAARERHGDRRSLLRGAGDLDGTAEPADGVLYEAESDTESCTRGAPAVDRERGPRETIEDAFGIDPLNAGPVIAYSNAGVSPTRAGGDQHCSPVGRVLHGVVD